jgi:hypothetical protein
VGREESPEAVDERVGAGWRSTSVGDRVGVGRSTLVAAAGLQFEDKGCGSDEEVASGARLTAYPSLALEDGFSSAAELCASMVVVAVVVVVTELEVTRLPVAECSCRRDRNLFSACSTCRSEAVGSCSTIVCGATDSFITVVAYEEVVDAPIGFQT